MMLAFVLIAGTLAAGAATLLLLPLMRRHEDARPAASVAAIVVLFALLLGGAGLYAAFSNYTWVEMPDVAETPAAMTAKLAQRLAREPGTVDDWLLLGRSYRALQQERLAIRAYQRADRMADGRSADALIGIAESLFAEDPQQLRGAAGHLFERALEIDPTSIKALFYSAFAALGRGERDLAHERLVRLLAMNPDPEIREFVERGIAQLENTAAQPSVASDATAATVSVHVTLAPALAAKVSRTAKLFVAARDPKAPGPPFAVKLLPAQFPVDVELTGADAMLESRRIAAGQQLEVIARVALGGTPTATSGDPYGQVSYHVGKDGRLNIVIDRLSP